MMNVGRLTTAERIAALSAIVLFFSTFLDWFVVKIPESTGVDFFVDEAGRNAWVSLDYIPIVLVAAIIVPLGVAGWRLVDLGKGLSLRVSTVVLILGIFSALLILFRIVDPPKSELLHGAFGQTVSAQLGVEYGIFIGLIGAVGIAFGGYTAMRDKGCLSKPHPDQE